MARNPYKDMADRINAMKPGTAWRISRRELNDLPALPDWAFMADITMGFERVKESVIGSAYPDLWEFVDEPNGDITVYRKAERKEMVVSSPPDRSWVRRAFLEEYQQYPVFIGVDMAEPDDSPKAKRRRELAERIDRAIAAGRNPWDKNIG